MNRPRHVWLSFAVCLAVGIAAMLWLTKKACELDLAEATSRQQAQTEEAVGRALWRMDTRLAPILAEEAARPATAYRSERTAAPVLLQPAEFAILNFQLTSDGTLTSPQCVEPHDRDWALQRGVTLENLTRRTALMERLRSELSYSQILAVLPLDSLPSIDVSPDNNFTNGFSNGVGNFVFTQNSPTQNDSPVFPQGINNNSIVTNNGNNDFQQRGQSVQQLAKVQNNRTMQGNSATLPQNPQWQEGVSKPLWIGSELILARRVTGKNHVLIQGCWLDWPRLEAMLREEVNDLVPQAELKPIPQNSAVESRRLLASLPAQLIVPNIIAPPERWSPIRVSLLFAWGGLVISALAMAALLQGVITLSERRGDFVAAVTHELRTPLTTFRMYAEMLASGMVPEQERQQDYLRTLSRESDRLSHLVENVLQFAKLERGRPGRRREQVSIQGILDRITSSLLERTSQVGLELKIEMEHTVPSIVLNTDPAAIERILFNLVDNACKYASPERQTGLPAPREHVVHLQIVASPKEIHWRVRDHGPGIPKACARKLFQPFSKSVQEAAQTAPGVGLGLALSQRLAQELGGTLRLVGECNQGAVFELSVPR